VYIILNSIEKSVEFKNFVIMQLYVLL
jgi:hypothetical protein